MDCRNLKGAFTAFVVATLTICAVSTFAGGSGLNTVVVVNRHSPDSLALSNYYVERRQIPAENVLSIWWPGDNVLWSSSDFQILLVDPLRAMINARGLSNQIEYVTLMMDLPFEVLNGSYLNSTTSGLFYGLKAETGTNSGGLMNSYAATEQSFSKAKPASAPGYSFLTTLVTAGSLAQAKALVDQGVNSDGTFPSATVILEKSSDTSRNIRFFQFDNTIFNARLRGNYRVVRTNSDVVSGYRGLLGFQTGLYQYAPSANMFVPGAMADSMTSYGGVIFGNNSQTPCLAFIHAGASGSYGTVTEPTASTDKFPDAQNYFYQARGFSLAECYYQSLNAPYQGLIVGEPLAAPFARPASATWIEPGAGETLTGMVTLAAYFSAPGPDRPIQQVDLFVDGKYLRTLTNVQAAAGNQLNLNVNNTPVAYTVPAGATAASVATALTSLLNASAVTAATKTTAAAHGDRIELVSTSTNRARAPGNFRSSGSPGAASTMVAPLASGSAGSAAVQTTFLSDSRPTFLDTTAYGIKTCTLNGTASSGSWLRLTVTRTNGLQTTVSVTNQNPNGTPMSIGTQMLVAVNANAALQGADGVMVEDIAPGWFGSALINLRARAPGYRAAQVRVQLNASGSLTAGPSLPSAFEDGISDLRARNHLYISVGVTNMYLEAPLDTTTLADGYHELSLVAYEGTHVRTQARASVLVRIQNTPLLATLTLLDLTNSAPVSGTYHVEITANANNVSRVRLFSTGGELGSVVAQPVANLTVAGPDLGVGLHPFYAVVEAADGAVFRTEPQSVRLEP